MNKTPTTYPFILAIINDRGECYTEPYPTREMAERAVRVLRSYGWSVTMTEEAA